MGFHSPAADYIEQRISLDEHLIAHHSSTYFMRAGEAHYRDGIMQGAILIVDSSLNPCDGSLLICSVEGELRIKRYRTHPEPHLVNLESGKREDIPGQTGDYNVSSPVFGVITYIINDARSGEFDDCPVM